MENKPKIFRATANIGHGDLEFKKGQTISEERYGTLPELIKWKFASDPPKILNPISINKKGRK